MVILPKDNEPNLEDVPEAVKESMEIVTVSHMDEVLPLALAISDPAELFSGMQSETV
jgi:ATP-dependent Lon protease